MAEFFVALIVALLVSVLFGYALRRRIPRKGFFWFFLILLLATWAGGMWIGPFGPSFRGIFWLPFVLVAVVVGAFLAAIAPRRAPTGRIETLEMLEEIEQKRKLEKLTYISFGVFFWVALFALITVIIVRYAL
ncbi:MAG: hypothetical protein LJE88_16745 [Deltaproteobacteria bacterium]|nr:hypothetical protein [Deltaproteobacteria bacterium]